MRSAVRFPAVIPAVLFALVAAGPVAGAAPRAGETITVEGFLGTHVYDEDGNPRVLMVLDNDSDGWILVDDERSRQLRRHEGGEVKVTGLVQEYRDDEEDTLALKVTSFEVVWSPADETGKPGEAGKKKGEKVSESPEDDE